MSKAKRDGKKAGGGGYQSAPNLAGMNPVDVLRRMLTTPPPSKDGNANANQNNKSK